LDEQDDLVLRSDLFAKRLRHPPSHWDDEGDEDPNHSTYRSADHGPSPVPDWVITEDAARQVDVGPLKSGKEADVVLVERTLGQRRNLLAAKRYRGFDQRQFKNDARYRLGRRTGERRLDLAVAKGSSHGIRFRQALWVEREFEVLGRLWSAGVAVPYPVQKLGSELMLEYLGDDAAAAPRLAERRRARDELTELCWPLADDLRAMVRLQVVHADLSPYNLLVWRGRLHMIDFPQAVDPQTPDGMALLHRDVVNVFGWFARRGVPCDPESLFGDLVAEAFA